ncbi:MAG: alpha/beta fold hydrolase [Patescibacteria group bacterium]|nr:alpha/beta fold hydrolase [Patescibacteria group bacterium]
MRKEFFIKKPPSYGLRRSSKKSQRIPCVLYSKDNKIDPKIPTVIYCHGFTGHKEEHWYPRFFSLFPKKDYQLVAFDMYAHGQSQEKFIDFTLSKALSDYKRVYNYVANQGVKRIAIAGHSLGGAASILVANDWDIHCLILLSPVTDRFYFERNLLNTKKKKKFLNKMSFFKYTDSVGLVFKVGDKFFKDFLKHRIRRKAARIKKPILLIHAEKDNSVPLKEGKELNKTFDFDITDFKIIKGADHGFKAAKYHNQVIKHFFRWTDRYLKKRIDEVVTVFIKREDGRILLLKRSQKLGTYQGLWFGVGGYVDDQESPRKAVFREIKEELNLNKDKIKIIKKAAPYRFDDKKYDKDWRIHTFLCQAKSGKIKTDWEADEYKWVQPKDILKYKTVSITKKGLKQVGLIK